MAVAVPAERDAGRVAALEQAFETHWRHFGLYPGARLRDEDGVLWFESPIRHLPYNWVIRTRIPAHRDADAVLERVAETFRVRNVPFMWVHRPSDEPLDLGQRLPALGLSHGETATGMDLDLADYEPRPNRSGAQVVESADDEARLQDYEELIRTYWSVPDSDRRYIQTLNRHWTGDRSPGVRLVAYLDGVPVGKLFMNTQEVPAHVAIYGVAVRPEARGRGIARALMDDALVRANAAGARRCVLHSSEMALPMYESMGFVTRCLLPVYATREIFETHHH
jgi:ribosomal protein S18 acetylase RimI-like enzyme